MTRKQLPKKKTAPKSIYKISERESRTRIIEAVNHLNRELKKALQRIGDMEDRLTGLLD